MQRHILILITCLLAVVAPAQNKVQKSVPTIYVDAGGVMRWSDTKKEASFFGVNKERRVFLFVIFFAQAKKMTN